MSDGLRRRGVCDVCETACGAADSVTVQGKRYHRGCARCTVCGLPLREGTLCAVRHKLFCPQHVPHDEEYDDDEEEEEDEEEDEEDEEDSESEEGSEDEEDDDEERETEDEEMTRMRETDPNLLTVTQMRKMLSYYGIDVPQKPLKKSEYIALVIKNLRQSPAKKSRREQTPSSTSEEDEDDEEEEESDEETPRRDVCAHCGRRIPATQEVNAGGRQYHRTCLRCSACGCTLGLMNFVCVDDRIYCRACAPEPEDPAPRGVRPREDRETTGASSSAHGTRAKRARPAADPAEPAAHFASPVKVEAQVIAVCHDSPASRSTAATPVRAAEEPVAKHEAAASPPPLSRANTLHERRHPSPSPAPGPAPGPAPLLAPAPAPPDAETHVRPSSDRVRTVRLVFSGLLTLGIVLLALALVYALALTPALQDDARPLPLPPQQQTRVGSDTTLCSDGAPDTPGCRPCPAHAACTPDTLACDAGYLPHGLACMRDLFHDDNVRRVAAEARAVLAREHWLQQCADTDTDTETEPCVTQDELARILRRAGILATQADYAAFAEAADEDFQSTHVHASTTTTASGTTSTCFSTDDVDRDYLSVCAWREAVAAARSWLVQHALGVLLAALATYAGAATLCQVRRHGAREAATARLLDAAERELLRTAAFARRVPGATVWRTAPELQRALMPGRTLDDAETHRLWAAAVAAMAADPRFVHTTRTVAGQPVDAFKLFGYGV